MIVSRLIFFILNRLRSLILRDLAQPERGFLAGRGICLALSLLLLFSGCMSNDGLRSLSLAETNIYHLARLDPGMTQHEVLRIMRQPYDSQVFEMDEDLYDVWFYVTNPTILGQSRMVPMNLTPLLFKNGILIGWGFTYYNYLVKRQEAAEKAMQKSPPAPISDDSLPHDDVSQAAQILSMSSQAKKENPSSEPKPHDVKKKESRSSPLNEEDEEMLENASDQEFNQT